VTHSEGFPFLRPALLDQFPRPCAPPARIAENPFFLREMPLRLSTAPPFFCARASHLPFPKPRCSRDPDLQDDPPLPAVAELRPELLMRELLPIPSPVGNSLLFDDVA